MTKEEIKESMDNILTWYNEGVTVKDATNIINAYKEAIEKLHDVRAKIMVEDYHERIDKDWAGKMMKHIDRTLDKYPEEHID